MQRTRLTTWIALILLGGFAALSSPATCLCASPPSPKASGGRQLPDALVGNSVETQAATLIKLGQERSTKSVPELAAALKHESTVVRKSAAWALTQMGAAAEPALSQLLQALTDDDEQVRLAAATALGQIGRKATLAEAALVTAIGDPNADVQCAALMALRTIGVRELEPAIAAFKHSLENGAADVRSETLATVSALLPQWNNDAKQQLAPSIAAAATADDDDVRLAAFVLLSDLGLDAAPAIALLARGANDLDEHVQAAAVRALDRFADAIEQQRNELNAEQLRSLRRPCELAARTLSGPAHDSSDSRRLTNRFQELADDIATPTSKPSLARSTAAKTPHHLLEDDDAEMLDSGDVTEVTTSTTPATTMAPVAQGGSWLAAWWALGAIAVVIAMWLLWRGLSRRETAVIANANLPMSDSQSASEKLNSQMLDLTNFDFSQSAETDLIDAHVLPAVMASLPAAQAVDEVSRKEHERRLQSNNSPIGSSGPRGLDDSREIVKPSDPQGVGLPQQPVHSQPSGVAELREEINRLSGVALDATAKLNRAMSDADSVVRWRAASAVTATHAATMPQLLAAAASNDPEVRRLAVSSLQGMGKEAVPPFVQALKDPNAELRQAAATALGRIGSGAIDAIPHLTSALQDPDARVRASAAFALSAFGPQAFEAIPALRQALTDPVPAVRARAAFALGQIGPVAKDAVRELAKLVSEPEVTVRRNAVSALGGIGADAGAALPELMSAAHDLDDGVRRCVMSVLGLIAPSTAEHILRQALSDKDAEVRHCAHAALVSSGLGVVAPQVASTPSTSPVVHSPAANPSRNVAPQTPQSTQPITLKVFNPQESGTVIVAKPPALAQKPAEKPAEKTDDVAALIHELESPDKESRSRATQALGQLGARAVPAIVAVMPRHNSETRRLLIHALGRIGSGARPALPTLLGALQDPQADVRCAATDCLGRLGVVNPSMLQALTRALSDRDAEVRRYAATTLGRFGQYAHSAQVDLQVAALGDPETKVRAAAEAALQRIMAPATRAA